MRPQLVSLKLVVLTAMILASWSAFALHSVTLAWDPSPDTNVVGYSVYFGPAAGNYTNRLDAGTNLTVTASDLPDGAFYFTATARNAQNVESDFANVVATNLLSQPAIVTSPTNVTVSLNSNAVFTVTASGGVLSYQWFRDGVALSDSAKIIGSTTSALTIKSAVGADIGNYSVIASNDVGTAQSAGASLSIFADGVPPVVTISWPTVNMTVLNGRKYTNGALVTVAPQVPLSGAATDANGITNVTVSRVFPPWAPLDFKPTLFGGSSPKQWTNVVQLVDGTNTFRVTASDGTGMTNALLRTIYLRTTNRLTVFTNGYGSIVQTSAAKNGAWLDLGRNYSIKAAAKAGNWFVNWTDGAGNVLATNVALTFRMTNDLVLVANFVTNGILAGHLAGAYNGLFAEESGVTTQSAGSISNFVVGSTRAFSGKLFVAGASYLISGSFDPLGAVTKTILRTGKPSLSVTLQMDFSNDTRQITGTVACAKEGWVAPVRVDQAFYNATNRNPMAARYTMAIPPLNVTSTNSPVGYGYGLITNSVAGLATMTGALADLTPLSFTSAISRSGDWPVCIDLYAHKGLLHGWINFSNGAPSGRLAWIKPANTASKMFTAGVNNTVEVFGSTYRLASPVIALPSGELELNTPISNSAAYAISVTNNNSIISPAHISGTVNTTTGLITLTLPATVTGVSRTAYGVVLQNTNVAVGTVSGTNAAVYLH